MTAWIASVPIGGQEVGGDLQFVSVCDYDLISRVVLADVSGHGNEAGGSTTALYKLMRKNINTMDQSEFMRGLNDAFRELDSGSYATAIALSFHRLTARLAFTNAGHPPPLWYHASKGVWSFLEEGTALGGKSFGLPVGLIPSTDYVQTVIALGRSDILVLYTDGITEAEGDEGKELGRGRLLEWARQSPVESAGLLGAALLNRFEDFRADRCSDDETLIVLRRDEEATLAGLAKVVWSNTLRRLRRNL